ncbi:hypothetical protein LY76DRAFT_405145 [Colletotrichum caudatum]|nr:hypothetical protein LY76DRAFT_405145 [Colletotrichum caudatum]
MFSSFNVTELNDPIRSDMASSVSPMIRPHQSGQTLFGWPLRTQYSLEVEGSSSRTKGDHSHRELQFACRACHVKKRKCVRPPQSTTCFRCSSRPTITICTPKIPTIYPFHK